MKDYAIKIGNAGYYKPGFNPVPALQAERYSTRVDAERVAGMLQLQYPKQSFTIWFAPELTTINTFEPETRSLIKRLTDAGFKLLRCDNGEDQMEYGGDLDKFLDTLLATDETLLDVLHPNGQKQLRLFLVLGNEPGVILSDYTYFDGRLDAVGDAHYEAWQDKPQPTRYGYYDDKGKFVDVPRAQGGTLKLTGNKVVIQSSPDMFK